MALRRIIAFLLLTWGGVLAAHAQEGCRQKESMKYSFSDRASVTFSALARPHSPIFEAFVTCSEETILHDEFSLSKQNISFTRTKKFGDTEKKKYPSPGTSEGWTEFSLVAKSDGYRLEDSKGHTWMSERDTQGCQADEVNLTKGVFMGECGNGSPTWQVSEGKCVEVPMSLLDSYRPLQVSLSSNTPFTPSFEVGGAKFALSWANEALLVVTRGDTEPLPSNRNLTFVLIAEGKTALKVLVSGHVDYVVNSTSKPNSISACGKHGHFSLQQHQEVNVCESTTLPTSVPPVVADKVVVIVVGTSLGILVMAALFVSLYCKARATRENQSVSVPEQSTTPPPSLQLPLPTPPTVPVCSWPQGTSSSQAEIYCEMVPISNIPPPLWSYEVDAMETLNDTYESAG